MLMMIRRMLLLRIMLWHGMGLKDGLRCCWKHGREVGSIRIHPLPLGDFQPRRQLLLPLGTAILEPGLDLDLGQVQALRKRHPFAHAQVLVVLEF